MGGSAVECDPWRIGPLRPGEPDGACAVGPDRVDQNVQARHLDQDGCVPHHRYREAVHATARLGEAARRRLRPSVSVRRRSASAAGRKASGPSWLAGVEEAGAVEVVAGRAVIVAIGGHEDVVVRQPSTVTPRGAVSPARARPCSRIARLTPPPPRQPGQWPDDESCALPRRRCGARCP